MRIKRFNYVKFKIICLFCLNFTKEFINLFVPKNDTLSLEERFCDFLSIDIASEEFCKFNWLEIFSDKLTGIKDATPAQILQKIMEEKLSLDIIEKKVLEISNFRENQDDLAIKHILLKNVNGYHSQEE